MLVNCRDISVQKMAWINYRGRLRETVSLLAENLADADDAAAQASVTSQIGRRNGYLQRAEERISELSR